MLSKCKKIIYSLTTFGVIHKHIVTNATFNSLQNVLLLLNKLFFGERCLLLKHATFWKMLILHTFSPDTLGRSINFLNYLSTELTLTVYPLMNNEAEIKIKQHCKHTNWPWLGKFYLSKNKKSIFVYIGATNCVHNIKMYANKFAVYAKFLEAAQSFVCQYNKLLLSFVYFDPPFFIGWKLFCIFSSQSFDLNV